MRAKKRHRPVTVVTLKRRQAKHLKQAKPAPVRHTRKPKMAKASKTEYDSADPAAAPATAAPKEDTRTPAEQLVDMLEHNQVHAAPISSEIIALAKEIAGVAAP